ncbi:MAG: hypothetical protein K2G33_03080 [Duncaniella sp.]|nr:hypothetical protein [Duncaniella sp.]
MDYAPKSTDGGSLNYDFTLTEFGGEIENGFREIKNPTKEELERAIKNIVFYDGEFFTLISSEPINGYTMLGGMVLYGDSLITASAHVEYKSNTGKVVKAYDKSGVSSAGLLEMLMNFMDRRTPNVNDGSWKFDEVVYSE